MSVLGPKGSKRGLWRFQLIEAGSKLGGLINGNYAPVGADQSYVVCQEGDQEAGS
jgi:hypothetical protein